MDVGKAGWRVLVLGLTLMVAAVRADEGSLFQVRVDVPDQSPAARASAQKQAFNEVMVRLSGQRAVVSNPEVARAGLHPESYMKQFSYDRRDITSDDGSTRPQTVLVLQFQPLAITQLLKKANVPLWPANRSPLAMWLLVEVEGERSLINKENNTEAQEQLQREGERRGLPLSFPFWGADEQEEVGEDSLWNLKPSGLLVMASERYGSQAYVLGRVKRDEAQQWQGAMLLVDGERQWPIHINASSLAEFSARLIDGAADHLASHQSVTRSVQTTQGVLLAVQGVVTYGQYRQLDTYLRKLVVVSGLRLRGADEHRLLFEMTTDADLTQLQKLLERDGQLQMVSGAAEPGNSAPGAEPVPDLVLRLVE